MTCPTGWGMATDSSIDVCKKAVSTNYFPLWEAEAGNLSFTKEVKNPKPVTELTKMIKKFSHLNEEELEILQQDVDFNYKLLKQLSGLDSKCPLPSE